MKLYKVSVETEVMVVAESEGHAENVAERSIHSIAINEPFQFFSRKVENKAELNEWAHCIPYGEAHDKVCLDIMLEQIEESGCL